MLLKDGNWAIAGSLNSKNTTNRSSPGFKLNNEGQKFRSHSNNQQVYNSSPIKNEWTLRKKSIPVD